MKILAAKNLKRHSTGHVEKARRPWAPLCLTLILGFWPAELSAQNTVVSVPNAVTWRQVRERFEATNPTLKAVQLSIDESRAAEITAFLRPNPDFSFASDGTQLTRYNGVWQPFAGTQFTTGLSYLHERQNKGELRRDSARESTAIAESSYLDQQRGLLFNLRTAFVQTLQAKAVLENAKENLAYWDRELGLNRNRLNAGDLALIDLSRMELQRVQFESDFETAVVNLRTAKTQLLLLLNERAPIEQLDVSGPFDFLEELPPLEQFRKEALEIRPDLQVASRNVELAKVNHQLAIANASTDPTFSGWWTHNPSFNNPHDYNTVGASVSIPLRIFDRNQERRPAR
jgi:cobalt-zinc-cadmium efflux system outer membrane protein